uniref:Ribosomal protein L5 n=1 Tax=Ulva intestinalis TaxID=3116 RepID=A0A8K1M9X2_ULVIN|nr:ribosomal protein L5 [Ulva intestinalis]UBR43420.1 ribosomal protein L5 [Ulva intestinalis]
MKHQKCIDQQILSWHKFSIQRYELTENSTVFSVQLAADDYRNCNNFKTSTGEKQPMKSNGYVTATKAHFNHPKLWNTISQIGLHATTKKLLLQSELYAAVYKCFCCCGQTPRLIKSKQPIAAFKVIKGAVVGAKSHVRKKAARLLVYKWSFLSAHLTAVQLLISARPIGAQKSNLFTEINQRSIGVNNIFILPELDKLNYSLFQPIPGFDVTFHYT